MTSAAAVLHGITPVTANTPDCDCSPSPVTTRHGHIYAFAHQTTCYLTVQAKGMAR